MHQMLLALPGWSKQMSAAIDDLVTAFAGMAEQVAVVYEALGATIAAGVAAAAVRLEGMQMWENLDGSGAVLDLEWSDSSPMIQGVS